MTLLEKLRETDPYMVLPPEHVFHDCGRGCPGDHKVLNTDRTAKNCGLEHRENLYVLPDYCRKCWAREYKPEPVTPTRKPQDAPAPAEGQTVAETPQSVPADVLNALEAARMENERLRAMVQGVIPPEVVQGALDQAEALRAEADRHEEEARGYRSNAAVLEAWAEQVLDAVARKAQKQEGDA